MKLAIIGASGFVGTALTLEALHRGHEVTAIVRHPDKVTMKHPHLTVVAGNALDAKAIAPLLRGHDAVLSAFNAGWANPHLYEDFLNGSKAIQEGTRLAGVRRLLVVGGAGSLEAAPGVQLVDTPQFPAEWKQGALAARDYLQVLRGEKELEWTFLSPAIHLEPGDSHGAYRTGLNSPVFDKAGESKITVSDLAIALLDVLEGGLHIRERFTVGY